MNQDLWLNLPVKNAKKSKAFFKKIGFKFNPQYVEDGKSCCLVIGEKGVVVMLFEHPEFKKFTGRTSVADLKKGNEVLISLSAKNRKEVDAFAKKVKAAGGTIFSAPAEYDGWMYGCGVKDLDGHRWNMLFMDLE